jgi:hypothetical protein
MKAENFFTEAENAQIAAAIEGVEGKTLGKIAVMVRDDSNKISKA